ncbi:killer cell lectin-like receptor subfamily G member 1 isoform X7 [Oryzias latipes]|uniref:killer cell lectin-like receptor subfamily G member 1 isoform X7 n=1 Tax=Oryzias latipes TaxID=8090 RepID=UPI000CE1AB8B|nr:killer cell lectin-like receptor subfamily G member 1 isoform X7 [Oryzias latipes]
MSTQTEAAADWRVKFSRNLHPDGREQSEVEMLDDEEQHSDHGLQQTGNQKQKNLKAERRNCFRVFKFSLGVFCFLILAGLMTRYLLVSLENNKLQIKLSVKWCPEGWRRFGSSCYYESTEKKNWTDSRDFCQNKGFDLVVVNSKEEQQHFKETL